MADDADDDLRNDSTDEAEGLELPHQIEDRKDELLEDSGVEKAALEIYQDIAKGFQDQWERSNSQMD